MFAHYRKHGHATGGRTRFYRIWSGILGRCNRKTDCGYSKYGLLGIKCEWVSFIDFLNDMYDSYCEHVSIYGELNTTIDRIDNYGNYCKDNCRRSTCIEQGSNRRNNVIGSSLMRYCRENGLSYHREWYKLRRGKKYKKVL